MLEVCSCTRKSEEYNTSMTKKNVVSVSFILDKSGSMQSVRGATISGFNEYIGTLKKDKKADYELTLTLFDTSVTTHERESIEDVSELTTVTYDPNGGTALYDAAVTTIQNAVKTHKGKSLVIIMTDGEENSSKEHTEEDLKKLIKKLEKTGEWTFVFLGANQDSYAKAAKYGISAQNATNFNASDMGTRAAFVGMAVATSNFASEVNTVTDSFFSKEQQKDIEDTK